MRTVIVKLPEVGVVYNCKSKKCHYVIVKSNNGGYFTLMKQKCYDDSNYEMSYVRLSIKEIVNENLEVFKSLGFVEDVPEYTESDIYNGMKVSNFAGLEYQIFQSNDCNWYSLDEYRQLKAIKVETLINQLNDGTFRIVEE